MNDMILNMLANDSFTVSDFKAVGLTAENTKLESEEKYKASQMIQENDLFQDSEGNFSEELFHKYYLGATEFYNRLADETYLEDLSKNTAYSKDNLFAPEGSKVIDETPKFVVSPNPFLQTNSLTRVGKKGDRVLSIAEIAQSQKVYDSKKEEFKDESVNDRAFGNNPFKWLSDLISEPLVIAQWDEDGEHVDLLTGEVKKHRKGDYKYNEEGTFYYETLNGRDVYGRQVLNRMNTLTVDGSAANAYDFFDSDDLQQKNVIGNTMKNLALVGSMFLPVVGNYVVAASIATQSVGLLGALGKMFLGSNNEIANNLHGWAKTVNRHSTSEYAAQNTWCWENLINMIGDTVGQLKEQRFLFTHVPALFKGTKGIKAQDTKTYNQLVDEAAKEIREKTGKDLSNAIAAIKTGVASGGDDALAQLQELGLQHATISQLKASAQLEKYMEGYRHLGSVLSKAYMTGVVVQDTYGETKANGASDLEAFALTLGYAAGEAYILNTGLGEWIMPELHGNQLKYKAIVNALKKEIKPITDNLENTATAEGRRNVFKQIFNIGKKIWTDDFARAQFASAAYNPMKVIMAHAGGEAFEELSEEVLADFSKSAFNTINWLRGDETRIAGAWENIVDRYGMSLLGGFLGGGISSVNTDFKQARELSKMTQETALQEIVYMINNDKIDDFLKFVNKQPLGNKHLKWETDENGNYLAGDENNNQDKEVKQMLNYQIQLIKDTVAAEGAKFSENALFDALTLKDLRYLQLRNTRTAGLMFQEYNSLCTKIVEKVEEIKQLTGQYTDTDTKKKELNDSEKQLLAQKNKELDELRLQKDAITSGKRAPEFIASAMYEASPVLHGHKRGYTFDGYLRSVTNKSIEELSESDIEKYKKEYIAYRDTEMKNDVLGDARQFVDLVGLASRAIQDSQSYIESLLTTGKDSVLKVQTSLNNMFTGLNIVVNEEDFDADTFLNDAQIQLNQALLKTETDFTNQFLTPETKARLNYLAQVETDEIYTEDMKKMDQLSVILETFADYADTITNKFIQQGYIHPEVKQHLLQTYQSAIDSLEEIKNKESNLHRKTDYHILNRFSAYLGKTKEEVEDLAIDQVREELFNGYLETLENKITQIKELSHTPIIELLENFKTATSDSNTSVRNVMENVRSLLSEGYFDVSEITYDTDFGKQLNEVEEIIDLYTSALYATRTDKSATNNAWGYSKTLNELNRKYGNDQWVELAEIEGENADLIMQDLALIKEKIQFAKNLNAVNTGQKLTAQTKVGYNKQYIFFNKFQRLVNYLEKDRTKWKLDSIDDALSRIQLLKKYNHVERNKRRLMLTPAEKIQIEKESLILDSAIYQFFADNEQLLTDVDALAELISQDNFNLFDPATTLLNDQTEDLDDNQFIFNIAAKAALNAEFFYDKYRQTFNDKKAPVPLQEQATFLNVAMVLNGNVINHFAKAYAKSIFTYFNNLTPDDRKAKLEQYGKFTEDEIKSYVDNPDSFKNDSLVEKFANIVLTEGISGSGKTQGVFDSTKRVLEKIDPDLLNNVFFLSATLKNAEHFLSELDLKGKAFSSSNKEKEHDLITYFYSDFTPNYEGRIKLVNGDIVHDFKLKKDLKDLPKVIFVDEVSRYDYVKMKLLSEAAQHYGIVVLAAGDFDQISAKSSIMVNKKKIDFSPNRLNFIRSPKLGLSFRTLNSQMSKNQNEVQANLHTPGKKVFTMHYWENDEEIRGFKTYSENDFDKVVEYVNKIKKLLKPEEKINYQYAQEDLSMHKKLQEKFGDLIEAIRIDDAQGLEDNYYIIDLNHDTSKDEQDWRDEFYTAFTRAKKGGIIISPSGANAEFKVNSVQDEVSNLESIPPQAIINSSKNRKEIFDKIYEGKDEVEFTYVPITPVEKETIVLNPNEEAAEEEGLGPTTPQAEIPHIPNGMYASKEEAEKIDLSAYQQSFELLDANDQVVGVIERTEIIEHKDGDKTYYAPAVIIKDSANVVSGINHTNLSKYKLKDPSNNKQIPKYTVGNVFYHQNGDSIEILEVIEGPSIQYKIKDNHGQIQTVLEEFFADYSTTPPIVVNNNQDESDLGENEDPETYKKRLETENGSKIQQKIESDGKINHWVYSFASYETGVLWNEDDTINSDHFQFKDPKNRIAQRTKARVDNVNGLINLGIVGEGVTKSECLDYLDDIHGALMYETNNQTLLNKVAEILDISDSQTLSSVEFGVKSSAMISSKDQDKIYGTADKDTDWYVFDKHRSEKSEYTQSDVVAGDHISRKSIVAVFRDSEGKKVLEITLGVLNSPLTIGQMQNTNGEYIYPEIGALLEQLTPDSTGEEIFTVCSQCEQKAREKNYHDLANLFKAFLFTSNAYVPLFNEDGSSFNLASTIKQGSNIIKKKGNYQKNGKQKYETKYIDLSEFVKDDRVLVSDVWIPHTNTYAGVTYAHIHPGHAGVFVSYNPEYKKYNKNDLANIYLSQLQSKKEPRDIEFYYIIPPEASVREYLQNFRNAYLNDVQGGNRPVVTVGNMWTSYKLLKNIYQGGELNSEKLKSKLLDYIELDDIIDYVKQLVDIENRTDWSGDAKYESLLSQYKKLYTSEKVAKKYAIRNTILAKQKEILQSNFGKLTTPVYKVFTSYISNAAYWKKEDTAPHMETIEFIEKYNKGTIKYKVRLNPNSGLNVGMFSLAKVSNTNHYAVDTITEEGNLSQKEFQINSKIDPPIFESQAFKTAVGILAQWEYEEKGNTNSRKNMLKPLNDATRGYLSDTKGKKIEKNNFEKLKEKNKIYFKAGGLLANITVNGENDPSLNELHFATDILSKFNSHQNNLGFAIVQADGSVKLYAFKITDFTDNKRKPEMETFTSLGGITVGVPLVFQSPNDTLAFSSANRDYKLSITGTELILQHTVKESKYSNVIQVQYTDSVVMNQDVINGALAFINNDENGFNLLTRTSFAGLTYDELINLTAFDIAGFKQQIELTLGDNLDTVLNKEGNEDMLKFYNFLKNGPAQTINLTVGDKVSLSDTTFVPNKVVQEINGNLIKFTDGTSADLTTDTLFKADEKVIDCVKHITIPYGN